MAGDSPLPVLTTPVEDRDHDLDGRLWPASPTMACWRRAAGIGYRPSVPGIIFLIGNAAGATFSASAATCSMQGLWPTGLVFRYSSPGRSVVVPTGLRSTLIDGKNASVKTTERTELDHFAAGWRSRGFGHDTTKAGVAVNMWGWASASAITAFGGIATALMVFIYLEVRVRRVVRRRGTA